MDIKKSLSEKIAGEITFSPRPGETIRKWRNVFCISQTDLAHYLDLSPSVISDYESGRRKSPGIQNVRKIIEAFLNIDESHGGKIIHQYSSLMKTRDGIIDIMEYPFAISARDFFKRIEGNVVTSKDIGLDNNVKGFTLVDSIKTIETISAVDYAQLYGWNTERALVFTGIRYGRSPLIAVRVHPVKPSVIVYHKPGSVDPLAVKLSERENIPLGVTNLPIDELQKKLRFIGER